MNKEQNLMKSYPYQDLSLAPIEGERWKDIPGYEDYYMVSDLGRIQSLPRHYERWGKNGYMAYTTAAKVRKQLAQAEYNPQTKDYNRTLVLQLSKDGVCKKHVVARLVYAAFVNEIDFQQDALSVLHRNGDIRDNRLSNLYLATMSERSLDGRRRGRQKHNPSDFATPEHIAARGQKRRVSVSQYSMDGKLIQVFSALKAAAAALNIHRGAISTALSGRRVSAGGYLWRKGIGEPTISTEAVGQRWNGKRGLMKREQKKLVL
jgi:hypothetical protein